MNMKKTIPVLNSCDKAHVQQTWRTKRPKTVVSHYLENPPKPSEKEFVKGCSKSNAILKRCVLCDYKEKEKKLRGTSNLTQFYFKVEVKSNQIINYLLSS